MSKPCFKCSRDLPISEFYRHPEMADGHLGKCKECTCADVRANRRRSLGHYRSYDRERTKRDPARMAKWLEQLEAWKADPLRSRIQSKRYRARYPEKKVAVNAVSNAIRDGRLQRRPCEVCGDPNAQGHHDDYSRRLDVRWLCRHHHLEHHMSSRL